MARDAAPDHLAFDAEIPEAHAEGDGGADADEDQRRRLKQDGVEILGIGQRFDDELIEQSPRLHAGRNQQRRRYRHSGDDGAGENERLTPAPECSAEPRD